MSLILNSPDDQVATLHEEHEIILCIACSRDFQEDHKHFYPDLTQIPILAKNCGLHEKCDRCHTTFLDLEF